MGQKVKFFLVCPECGRTKCHHDPSKGSMALVLVLGVVLVGSLMLFSFV